MSPFRIQCLVSALCVCGGLSVSAAQSVIVVDASGAGDFTDMQPAVNAAMTGDVILVRSVLVPGATIDGKGLTIVGESGAAPDVGKLYVFNLPAGQFVVVRHVNSSQPANMFEAMKLQDDLGMVFVEDVVVAGSSGAAFQLAAAGLRAVNCASVVLNHSQFSGGHGESGSPYWPAFHGGTGLVSVDSHVSGTWSRFKGGAGDGGSIYPVASGGDGIGATGGYLFLSGSDLKGGGNVDCTSCGDDFSSDGLHLVAGLAQYTDTSFAAGPPPPTSPPGQDIDAAPGTAQNLNEKRRALFVSSPLRFLEAGILIYEGAPHDRVAVFSSAASGFLPLPSKVGVWQLADPVAGPALVGEADAAGHLEVAFHAPSLAPLEGATVFLQAAVMDPVSGLLRLSGPTSLTLLDPSL